MDRAAELAARWIDAWTRGWRDHDPDAVASAYAADALFVSHPFREPEPPGDYARAVFADEEAVEFWFAVPRPTADGAAVPWWAISRAEGRDVTLAGLALLRFGEDGLVVEDREYWAEQDGAHRPPDGWGPVATHAVRS